MRGGEATGQRWCGGSVVMSFVPTSQNQSNRDNGNQRGFELKCVVKAETTRHVAVRPSSNAPRITWTLALTHSGRTLSRRKQGESEGRESGGGGGETSLSLQNSQPEASRLSLSPLTPAAAVQPLCSQKRIPHNHRLRDAVEPYHRHELLIT